MSYSQNGEDEIVAKLFAPDFKGTLLEIGAYDPVRLSNSRLLIERGWSAVLCEFSPAPVRELVREYCQNSKVQVVAAAITPNEQHVRPFWLTDDALSTDSAQQKAIWEKDGGYYGILHVPTLSVAALLSQFFGQRACDFASVDTEGSSADVGIALMRSDHRPRVMVIEHNNRTVEIMAAAEPLGYRMVHLNSENMVLKCRK